MSETMITHKGACHCGAIRFEIDAAAELEALECNCSICTKSGYVHLIVPAGRFRLLSGREHLTTYRFGTRTAEHFFCTTCGIKSFYIPRSNPDGYSVNVRCLEPSTIKRMTVQAFDGENWEQNAERLASQSRE